MSTYLGLLERWHNHQVFFFFNMEPLFFKDMLCHLLWNHDSETWCYMLGHDSESSNLQGTRSRGSLTRHSAITHRHDKRETLGCHFGITLQTMDCTAKMLFVHVFCSYVPLGSVPSTQTFEAVTHRPPVSILRAAIARRMSEACNDKSWRPAAWRNLPCVVVYLFVCLP